jgi:hypothetical protein
MSDIWLRRSAWVTTIMALALLSISAIMLFWAPERSNLNWLENQVKAIATSGAPILGLIIVTRQPRQRIGWLWIIYGLAVGFRTMGHAIYYFGGAQPDGYSPLEQFFLWSTEVTNFAGFACLILLMLWFPNGHLLSRKWRWLTIWLFLVLTVVFTSQFTAGPNWNGGVSAGGIIIDNPYGWLPENAILALGLPTFISIILIMVLAASSLFLRYRSAGQLVRLQLRWFVLGGFLLVGLTFAPLLFVEEIGTLAGLDLFLIVLSNTAIVPLYMAVGIAILRYRLYDFDIIIRRTLVYSLVTVALLAVYFGSVVLLQRLFTGISGQQSPLAIVISTLLIAALFNPLRHQVQSVIDRRFYRKKYDAQQVLEQFAQTARDETDMDVLTAELTRVIQETMQPKSLGIWVKNDNP